MNALTRDPGLQPERTRLAWRRTTLAFTVAAALAVRQVVRHGSVTAGDVVAFALSAVVWLGFLAVAHRRIRAMALLRPPGAMPFAQAAAATVCTLALAGFAAAIVW
ncbi:DUF202 domain-containing protein [Streptomyces spongiicola]|uniref:DUF202 domain-containing protein n=1 Tax=Streptomyces spongiicola TaxID=1690221 RepID=A0A2S1YUX1_9ACTN|nr:DUF202 domain-containing protein [Streptomyces spongiicola]AWK07891.1 hypothetical protein DDQ41_01970 [Streptomyces spongiicola]GBQ01892.1 DUF202 domain-containing protein [Streptomyces spongiicola]